jgi:hypothetical protein
MEPDGGMKIVRWAAAVVILAVGVGVDAYCWRNSGPPVTQFLLLFLACWVSVGALVLVARLLFPEGMRLVMLLAMCVCSGALEWHYWRDRGFGFQAVLWAVAFVFWSVVLIRDLRRLLRNRAAQKAVST